METTGKQRQQLPPHPPGHALEDQSQHGLYKVYTHILTKTDLITACQPVCRDLRPCIVLTSELPSSLQPAMSLPFCPILFG